MNRQESENKALGVRILYELKHALWSANFKSGEDLIFIGDEIGLKGFKFILYFYLKKIPPRRTVGGQWRSVEDSLYLLNYSLFLNGFRISVQNRS